MKCCDITAGMLRHLVDLSSQLSVADGGGGTTLNWVPYAIGVRGFLKPISVSERLFAQRLEKNISHRLLIRYRTDIRPDHRVVYSGREMQIRGILNIEEMNRWLQVELEEGVTT